MMVENAAACLPLCLPLHDQRQLSVTRTQTLYLEDEVLIVTDSSKPLSECWSSWQPWAGAREDADRLSQEAETDQN